MENPDQKRLITISVDCEYHYFDFNFSWDPTCNPEIFGKASLTFINCLNSEKTTKISENQGTTAKYHLKKENDAERKIMLQMKSLLTEFKKREPQRKQP